ncbi:MAG: hypothetical protein ACRDNZ_23210 [Streptosporangiaceae bacterium]
MHANDRSRLAYQAGYALAHPDRIAGCASTRPGRLARAARP